MKKTLLKTMYNCGTFAPFRWANRSKVLILTYHRFSHDSESSKVSAREFRSHLQYLKKNNHVLPLAETMDYLKKGKSLPSNTTVITIDDGYADAYEIAFPLLQEFGLPATAYVITGFLDEKIWLWTDIMRYVLLNTKNDSIAIDFGPTDRVACNLSGERARLETASRINQRLKKLPTDLKNKKITEIGDHLDVEIPDLPDASFRPMSWAQAQEMDADGVRIESHTVNHPILTNATATELGFEMQSSKKRLEEVLGRPVDHFCYPNGSLNETVRAAAENAGYSTAVTTAYGFNDPQTDPFLLNRIDAPTAIESFAQSASGFEAARLAWLKP